jgi:hypothetical protein
MHKLIAAWMPKLTWKIALLVLGVGGAVLLLIDRLLGLAIAASLVPIALLVACAIPCLTPLVLLRRRTPGHATSDQVVKGEAGMRCSCGQAVCQVGRAAGTCQSALQPRAEKFG